MTKHDRDQAGGKSWVENLKLHFGFVSACCFYVNIPSPGHAAHRPCGAVPALDVRVNELYTLAALLRVARD